MVSICEDLQGYVPTISTEYAVEVPGESEEYQVTADNFHYVLLGMVIEAGVLSPILVTFYMYMQVEIN